MTRLPWFLGSEGFPTGPCCGHPFVKGMQWVYKDYQGSILRTHGTDCRWVGRVNIPCLDAPDA